MNGMDMTILRENALDPGKAWASDPSDGPIAAAIYIQTKGTSRIVNILNFDILIFVSIYALPLD
jgi:hypothetical protein